MKTIYILLLLFTFNGFTGRSQVLISDVFIVYDWDLEEQTLIAKDLNDVSFYYVDESIKIDFTKLKYYNLNLEYGNFQEISFKDTASYSNYSKKLDKNFDTDTNNYNTVLLFEDAFKIHTSNVIGVDNSYLIDTSSVIILSSSVDTNYIQEQQNYIQNTLGSYLNDSIVECISKANFLSSYFEAYFYSKEDSVLFYRVIILNSFNDCHGEGYETIIISRNDEEISYSVMRR